MCDGVHRLISLSLCLCVCVCRRWIGGAGGGAEQREGDVRFLPSPRPQLGPPQIRPHQLGKSFSKHFSITFTFAIVTRQ